MRFDFITRANIKITNKEVCTLLSLTRALNDEFSYILMDLHRIVALLVLVLAMVFNVVVKASMLDLLGCPTGKCYVSTYVLFETKICTRTW